MALSTLIIIAGVMVIPLSYLVNDSGPTNAARGAAIVMAVFGLGLCLHFYRKSPKEE